MAIAFNNTLFPTGYVGEDDGNASARFGIDNVSANPITVNGTVSKVGDPVTVTGVLPGGDDSGITSTTTTLFVTQYDNANMIQFSNTNPPTGESFRFVFSNTPLAAKQVVTFASDPALVNGTGGDVYQVTCFASGTLIRTDRGDVAVEALQVGDIAVTASGALRPIRWIGHRAMRPAAHAEPWNVHPVRVRAGAFGLGLPGRDLLLSPGHPVLVGEGEAEHLVPIMCLVNGTTVERVPVETVTYWHVELDAHDILLAEGLPAESYLDWGDRAFFAEGSDHALHNPDFVVPGLASRCRPVAVDGPVVEAERRRLDATFAASLGAMCAWPSHEATTFA